MRTASIRFLAVACLVSLGLAQSASAANILTFGQQSTTDFVSASVSGGSTTLSTNGPGGSPSIPITFGQLGTLPSAVASVQPGFETFINVHSGVGGATTTGTTITQDSYSGTIAFTATPVVGGVLPAGQYLIVTFSSAQLQGSGFAAQLVSTSASAITYTSNFAPVLAVLGSSPLASPANNFSVGLSNINNSTGAGPEYFRRYHCCLLVGSK